ncbi:hypothetical protein EV651_11215 [Kribbella sp. VKM Ac-2571]|uniref:hypothetical protein n=1 Tax=Kribbella sp. VKM Ac-2571 TaxID=2512222 RepID=UPI001062061A|nr:hypothetical protein [Kribbella sp. VKM Ac-2571]TDO56628.1 hypothetical protein EV651_11215 [Kribbella sp. VKM Ac-2571]
MSEQDTGKSAFGPAFVASCIVVGAVLACGVLILVSGRTSDRSDTASSSGTASSAAARGSAEVTATVPSSSGGAEPVSRSTTGSGRVTGKGCGLPDGDQTMPTKAPAVDSWEVSRRVVVPRSSAYGPARIDADGFRRCFAHSPTGAVFAAYNVVAALADQRQVLATVQKLMVPGVNADALIRELRKEEPADSSVTQVAGFRLLDAGRDRATVMVAVPVQTGYMSLTLTLVWYAGDWRVQPPPPGEPVGVPFSQHRDLGDFVAWSGV